MSWSAWLKSAGRTFKGHNVGTTRRSTRGRYAATSTASRWLRVRVSGDCQAQGGGRRLGQRAGVARRKDPDRVSPQRHRVRDRCVFDDPAVDVLPVSDPHGREDTRDRCAGEDRLDRGAGRQQDIVAAEHVGRDHVDGKGGLLEPLERQVPLQDAAQAGVGDQVVAATEKAAQASDRSQREDRAAAKAAPHLSQGLEPGGIPPVGYPGSVHGSYRGPDEQVGDDAGLLQRLQHAHVRRPQGGAAREHERGGHSGADPVARPLLAALAAAVLPAVVGVLRTLEGQGVVGQLDAGPGVQLDLLGVPPVHAGVPRL